VAAVVFAIFVVGALLAGWFRPWQQSIAQTDPALLTQTLPDRPSVAVLPFSNDSDDAEQEYFADGVTEDIITDLSKVSGLFVSSRGSTFAYKDPQVDLHRVADELGVRYVLTGSVRRSKDKLRITAQLVDAANSAHIWSERYDRDLKDVFAVQSDVASHVVKALAVTLKTGEQERLFQKYTTNIDAYDVFIRARRTVDVPTRSNIEKGEALFRRVIELDPKFAGGYAGLSFNYSVKARFGYSTARAADIQQSLDLAHEAIRIDPQFGWSYVALGGAYLAAGDPAAAVETMRQALVLLPGDYEVHLFTGLYLQFAGESAEAVKHLELAKRMNPVDTDRNLAFLGMAYFMNQDYTKAEDLWSRRMEKFPTGSPMGYVFLAASQSLSGSSSAASETAKKLQEAYPGFSLETWGWSKTYLVDENRERLLHGARMAGIP
jgi:adenylate cyclase